MINPRLFDQYGIDTAKDLGIGKRCPRPFDTVLIDKQGSCYACECTSWLPQSIGNLQTRPLDQILGSEMHQHLQGSIQDSTYRYCNEHPCPYILGGGIKESDSTGIRHLRLAIDDSCNLRCPSCRKGLIFHKTGSAYNRGIGLADKINSWLLHYQHPIQVHIGSDGDPFASHVYRHFMEHTPRRDNIKYSILTNALMIKESYTAIPHIMANLNNLGVSIDGASRQTYETLRLGGKWEKILEALECVSQLKQEHGFVFDLHMVVQQDNWREMPMMLDLGDTHDADKVYFNRIQDWNTGIDFGKQGFVDDAEFQSLLADVNKHPKAHASTLA
jgi:sulfatase maturation enzyme AslB (radical SAM superfamily)